MCSNLQGPAATDSHFALLACPDCGERLQRKEEMAWCQKCGEVGRQIDGVLCFSDPHYYSGEIPVEDVRRANRLSVETGWQQAVEDVVTSRELRELIFDPKRADFQYLWSLPKQSRILEVGAGWGGVASSLAENFREVVAVECVLERARFIHRRALASSGRSLEVVCADFLGLPFATAQFDAVVLNGVLPWIGTASLDGDPRDLELRFLRRTRELLTPRGIACVSTPNRVGWERVRGGGGPARANPGLCRDADGSRGCRPGPTRSDAEWGHRPRIHSLPGYRRLFREAGFSQCRAYHAWRGGDDPTLLLPLDCPHALVQFLEGLGPPRSLRARLRHGLMSFCAHTGLWAQTASHFVFVLESGSC